MPPNARLHRRSKWSSGAGGWLHRSGSSLKVRVGVATGLVVVADISDTKLPGRTEIIGITPALAARIQSEASPNSVAVAEATYRLTSGAFEFEEIGTRELKGFGEPVRLWRPVARRQQSDRFTAYRRVSAPLVGRDDELELCRRRWSRARDGSGQLVFLHGDAGIGKSRLVMEFRRNLASEGVATRVFQCQPRGNTRAAASVPGANPADDRGGHRRRRSRSGARSSVS